MNWGRYLNRLRDLHAYGFRGFVLLLAVGTLTASLWMFVALTEEILEGEQHEAENAIMLALRDPADPSRPIGPHWVREATVDITALGGAPVLTLFTVLVLGYLLLQRTYGAAALLLVATIGGTFLNQALKHFIDRERPSVVPHFTEISNPSYPSGHSMLSAIVYLTLAVVVAQTIKNRSAQLYVIAAALLLAFLVGVSRVVIGVHYPSDVLAGWTAGTAWAVLCWLVASWLKQRGMLREAPAPG